MSKLAEDIKLIVGIKDLENKIDALANKSVIVGTKGVALQSDTSIDNSSGTGINNGTNNNGSGNGTGSGGTAGGNNGTQGGSTIGNGGVTINPSQDNKKTADQLFGNTDPTSSLNTPYQLDTFEAFDCATGKKIIIKEDGSALPPPGWSTKDDGPEDYFFANRRWPTGPGGGTPDGYAISVSQSAQAIYINGYGGGAVFPEGDPLEGVAYDFVGVTGIMSTQYTMQLRQTYDNFEPIDFVTPVFDVNVLSVPCNPIFDDSCPSFTGSEVPEQWPASDTFQLIKDKDGVLRAYFRDPNVPTNFAGSNGSTTIDFCYGDGQTGRRTAAKGGGFMYFPTTGGVPSGNLNVYDSNRRLIAVAPSTDYAKYAP